MVSDNEQTIASLEVGRSLDHIWGLEREFLSVKRKKDLKTAAEKAETI